MNEKRSQLYPGTPPASARCGYHSDTSLTHAMPSIPPTLLPLAAVAGALAAWVAVILTVLMGQRSKLDKRFDDLKTEIQDNKAELKAEIQEVRTEVKEVRAELKAEMQDNKAELKAEIQEVRTEVKELRAEMKCEMQENRAEMKALREALLAVRA